MDVTIIGSGAGHRSNERNATAVLVRDAGRSILVDCGAGTHDAALRGQLPTQLDALLVTHCHPDHTGDFLNLLTHYCVAGQTKPLPVYAPPETAADLQRDVDRLTRMGMLGYPVPITAITPGDPTATFSVGPLAVTAFATDHRVESAGFRITGPAPLPALDMERVRAQGVPVGPLLGELKHGRAVTLPDGRRVEPNSVCHPAGAPCSVAITGDTAPSAAVVQAVAGADILVHDATYGDDKVPNAAKWAHSTARQAGEVAEAAGVRALVLTHISHRYAPASMPHRAEAESVFGGRAIVAVDGMTINARSLQVALPSHVLEGHALEVQLADALAGPGHVALPPVVAATPSPKRARQV